VMLGVVLGVSVPMVTIFPGATARLPTEAEGT
jgi:hypothetical protein